MEAKKADSRDTADDRMTDDNCIKKNTGKICRIFFLVMAALLIAVCTTVYLPMTADAAGVVVRFGSNYYNKNQGDAFPMGVYVQNDDRTIGGIGSYTVQISYDTTRMKYTSADPGYGGVTDNGNGTLTLTGTNNGVDNKTMIRFEAIAGGDAAVTVTAASVYGTDGVTALTVTSLGSVPVYIKGTEPETTPIQDGTGDSTQNGTQDGTGDSTQDGAQDGNTAGTENTDGEETDEDKDDNADGEAAGAEGAAEEDAGSADTAAEIEDTEGGDAAVGTEDAGSADASGTPENTSEAVAPAGDTDSDTDSKAEMEGTGNFLTKFASGITDDTLRMIVIIIVGILAVVIFTLIILLIVKTAAGKRRQRMNNDSNPDEGRWAFEFDTIDEDKTGEQISQDEIPSQFEENEAGFTDKAPDFSEDEPDSEFDGRK